MDCTSAYIFGFDYGTNLIEDSEAKNYYLEAFDHGLDGFFWLTEFSRTTAWLRRLGVHLVSDACYGSAPVYESLGSEKSMATKRSLMRKSSGAEAPNDTANPIVYAHYRQNLEKANLRPSAVLDQSVASEMMDHLYAAHEVKGNTLTYIM